MNASSAPAGLAASGRRLWDSVASGYELDVHEEILLLEACRCADRLDRLAVEVAAHPVVGVNAKGDPVVHPAQAESRAQALVLSRLLASLRLPSGDAETEATRPQRRGASRGSYGLRDVS